MYLNYGHFRMITVDKQGEQQSDKFTRRNIFRRWKYLMWYSDMEATRLTLGMSAILWGVLLAWPGDLFPTPEEIAAGRGRMTYAIMAKLLPEEVWAVLWLIQGAVMLYSLFTGVRNKVLLVADAILGVMLWTICVGSAFMVYWPYADFFTAIMTYKPPAAMAGELGMIAASWWVLVRYKCGKKNHDGTSD